MTYEEILKSALNRVDDKYSKRQDSPIFSAIAPSCYEMSKIYQQIQENLKQSFGQTARGIYLDNIVKEVGLERFKATYALKKAEFRDENNELIDIDLGTRFAKDEYSFEVIKKLEKGIYILKSEQEGTSANDIFGDIMCIDNISIASAKIIANTYLAVDEEDDEHLRARYLQKVREPATSGNIYHYRLWAMQVAGVGAVKVFPLWNGNGTVKLIIVNTDMEVADESLINRVINHIQSLRPIGATVSVISPTNKDISIRAKITSSLNVDIDIIKEDFKTKLENYIKDTVKEYFEDIKADSYLISLAQIGKHLLDSKNVVDYSELQLNNITSNIELTAEQIPNITDISLEVLL